MFCHDVTRYTLFLAGLCKPQFAELGRKLFPEIYLAPLEAFGCTSAQIKKVEMAIGQVQFDVTTDRSV